MKRPNSSKKNTNIKQKQTISLMNMINNILQINSTSKYFHISNFNSITNKTKLFLNKQMNNATYYPISSKKIQQLLQQKKGNLFFTTELSQERKSLRPKSSVCSARQYRASYNIANNHIASFNSIQDNCNKTTLQHEQMMRNSSYKFQINNKPQYQVLHLQKNNIKNNNKCPKSIHSNRYFGYVCGYAVNSYKFIQNNQQISEGRIIIISNLTKNNKSEGIVSLYCLLQTNKCVQYLDFIRQHLQKQLSKKLQLNPTEKITKQLIQDCLSRMQKQFIERNKKLIPLTSQIIVTNSGLSLAMVFIRNNQMTICTKGQSRIKFSQNFGKSLYGQQSQQLIVTTINNKQLSSLDFVCLFSQGINKKSMGLIEEYHDGEGKNIMCLTSIDGYQIYQENHSKKQWFQKQLWKIIINFVNSLPIKKQKEDSQYSLHSLMGLILDSMYSIIEKNPNSKNVSILLLGFSNLQQMLMMQQEIFIPFTSLYQIDKQIQCCQQKNIIK